MHIKSSTWSVPDRQLLLWLWRLLPQKALSLWKCPEDGPAGHLPTGGAPGCSGQACSLSGG